jgi:hypothetical protein
MDIYLSKKEEEDGYINQQGTCRNTKHTPRCYPNLQSIKYNILLYKVSDVIWISKK